MLLPLLIQLHGMVDKKMSKTGLYYALDAVLVRRDIEKEKVPVPEPRLQHDCDLELHWKERGGGKGGEVRIH